MCDAGDVRYVHFASCYCTFLWKFWFLFSSTELSAYMVQRWQYWHTLCLASSIGMASAGPLNFFMLGILLSLSSCIGPVLHSPCSVSLRDSMSNGSFWHVIPMFSGGSRYVSTSPVWRFSLKFDVLKNSLSVGLLNSILPSMVSSWSLFSIRSPTLVLQRSGTYQLRLMVPCCHTNSLMVSSLVLCSSTIGVVAWSVAFCTCSGFA